MPIFTHSIDMIGPKNLQNVTRDNDHAHYGIVCHPKANTWYGLPDSTCTPNFTTL